MPKKTESCLPLCGLFENECNILNWAWVEVAFSESKEDNIRMQKHSFIASFFLLLLAGCTNSATELNFPVMPPELVDCKVFKLRNENDDKITVMRCPNSTTSVVTSAKYPATSVVIDGGQDVPSVMKQP